MTGQVQGRNWAVALVHGVGNTEPIDMLTRITRVLGRHRPLALEKDVRVLIPEGAEPSAGNAAQPTGKNAQPVDEPVRQHFQHGRIGGSGVRFATAYWSDVSLFGEGLIRLIGNIALGGMGVRYLADVGSGGKSSVARIMHGVLNAKILLLALGFLPIVLCTLVFSLLTLIGYYLFRYETFFLQAWAIAILSLIGTWLLGGLGRRMLWHMRDQRSLALPIFNALRLYGVVMAVVMLVGHKRALGAFLPMAEMPLCARPDAPKVAMSYIEGALRYVMGLYGTASGNGNWQDRVCMLDETGVYIGFLQLLQYGCAFFVICFTAIVLILLFLAHLPFIATPQQRRGMRLAAVGVTTIWLLMLLVLWPENVLTTTVLNRYLSPSQAMPLGALAEIRSLSLFSGWEPIEINKLATMKEKVDTIREMIPLIWFDVFFTVLLLAVGVLAWALVRARNSWITARNGTNHEALLAGLKPPLADDVQWGPRLLLANSYQIAVIVFMLVISVTALTHYFHFDKWLDENVTMLKGIGSIPHEVFMPLPNVSLFVILAMGLFLVAAHSIQKAVKLALDVVNHFAAPAGAFPIRTKIAKRFNDTLTYLLAPGDKPHLVVICHSQGTVITLDRLLGYHRFEYSGYWPVRSRKLVWEPGLWQKGLDKEVASLTILTFGSPITHLYQHYFATLYPELAEIEALKALEAELKSGRIRWFNSYRVDDYIGTYIDPSIPGFPVNVPMPVGGHTDYWKDDVFTRLFDEPGMEGVLVDTAKA